MSENTSLRMELDSVRERHRALKAEFVEHENRFEVYLDRLYDLERWRESEMARRVDRASSPIDLTGDPDSDDESEVVEIPGFPTVFPRTLEELPVEEIPPPGEVRRLSLLHLCLLLTL